MESNKNWEKRLITSLETLPYVREAIRVDDKAEILTSCFDVRLTKNRDVELRRVFKFSGAWLDASNIRNWHIHDKRESEHSVHFCVTVP